MGNPNNEVILLVEDDPNDVFLIRRALEKANVSNTINVAFNGEEAVDYIKGAAVYADRLRYPFPTLVLLDLKLPRRSGFEVLEWLKTTDTCKRVPVVVLTSSAEASDINRAYDLGANSYLVKPVAFGTLLEMAKILNIYWLNFNEKPVVAGC